MPKASGPPHEESDMVCQLCKTERKGKGEKPRPLIELPKGGTQKGTKAYACEHCDGPVVELATR
jgi:hypothetical protein